VFYQIRQRAFKITSGWLIVIDGKISRGSYDTYKNQSPIHLVNAWSVEDSIVLGQYKVNEKSNEITALPELLKLLQAEGDIISIDAMGCLKRNSKTNYRSQSQLYISIKSKSKSTRARSYCFIFTLRNNKSRRGS
jgi:intergrase/recombinase